MTALYKKNRDVAISRANRHNAFMTPGGKRIYLDYAAATPVLPEAFEAFKDASMHIGNPGSIHGEAVEAMRVLTDARERIARIVGAKAREIIFTSGASESNNLAILGAARRIMRDGFSQSGTAFERTHWIVSSIEHASVLECFGEIERLGASVSFLAPDERGIITPEALARALKPGTAFVSIGWGNSEIGIVQPLARLSRVIREHEKSHGSTVIFHTDTGQAPLYEPSVIHSLGVDLASFDAGKLYAPRGIGALYVSSRASLSPILMGGKQEQGLRPGTESVALASAFAAVFDRIANERADEECRLRTLRGAFARTCLEGIPGAIVNGDLDRSLPHICNVSIPLPEGVTSEYVALALDHRGIAVSTKSACREGAASRSHVVETLGGPEWRARNTLRFSLGRETTEADIDAAARALVEIVAAVSAK